MVSPSSTVRTEAILEFYAAPAKSDPGPVGRGLRLLSSSALQGEPSYPVVGPDRRAHYKAPGSLATFTQNHRWCGRLVSFPDCGVGLACGAGWVPACSGLCRCGCFNFVPWMWSKGTVAANVGRLCART